jgi:hypothetical protein
VLALQGPLALLFPNSLLIPPHAAHTNHAACACALSRTWQNLHRNFCV